MPYRSRIKTLEESIRILDNKIFQLEKNSSIDTKKLFELNEIKDKYRKELSILTRQQWDHDHERVDLDDDR